MSARDAHHHPTAPHGRVGRLAAVGSLYDHHGPALFRLALSICRDVEAAGSAVVQAFDASLEGSQDPDAGEPTSKHLARLTYEACLGLDRTPSGPARTGSGDAVVTPLDAWLGDVDPQSRALLALVLHGDHTYTEAAALLDLDPADAAATLLRVLRDGAHVGSDGSA